MEKNCSICKRLTDSETSPILAMGAFGNPKYLCPECAEKLETVMNGREYDAIKEAMKSLGEDMAKSNSDDTQVLETVNSIFAEASERAEKIKSGNYDFDAEEKEQTDSELPEDDVPEELKESEEDRLLDEAEAKANKKLDNIITWVMCGVILAAFVFLGIKMFG